MSLLNLTEVACQFGIKPEWDSTDSEMVQNRRYPTHQIDPSEGVHTTAAD